MCHLHSGLDAECGGRVRAGVRACGERGAGAGGSQNGTEGEMRICRRPDASVGDRGTCVYRTHSI